MAKFEIRFIDATCNGEEEYIKVSAVETNSTNLRTVIELSMMFEEEECERKLWLDKSTAIKFAKTLRTEINKITESEVNHE